MHNIFVTNLGYIIGIIMVMLSIPLLVWDIPRNSWYGVRIPKAYVSNKNWKIINTYGAKVLIFWGFICIITVLFLNLFVKDFEYVFYFYQSVSFIFLIIAIVQILLFARKV